MTSDRFGIRMIDLRDDGDPGSRPARWLFALACVAWVAACLTILFLGMRGVMRLGGFVASGGPYPIAHPAPGWVWIVPVAVVTGLAAVFAGIFANPRGGWVSLLPLAWPALFVSLGWNFLEFGFRPPSGGGGVAWGWLVCGFLFIPMGLLPLLAARSGVKRRLVEALRNQGRKVPVALDAGRRFSAWPAALQLLAAAAGVLGGWRLFAAVAG